MNTDEMAWVIDKECDAACRIAATAASDIGDCRGLPASPDPHVSSHTAIACSSVCRPTPHQWCHDGSSCTVA